MIKQRVLLSVLWLSLIHKSNLGKKVEGKLGLDVRVIDRPEQSIVQPALNPMHV